MSRRRVALAGVLAAAVLLAAAIALPAFGVGGRAHRASLAGDAARALRLAKAADARSKKAAGMLPSRGPAGPAGPKGPNGPPGTNGFNGANGANGVNGGNGANGANGANGPPGDDGTDGTDGQAVRLTIDEVHDQDTTSSPTDYPISGTDTFTQKAGEFLLLTTTVDGTTGSDCTSASDGLSVSVLVDGDAVSNGFLPWESLQQGAPPQAPVDFSGESIQNGMVPPPAADTVRTVTVEVSDSCDTADDWTVSGVHVSVAGTG